VRVPQGVTIWLALWRVTKDIDRIAQRDIASLGLGLTDFGVLECLLHRGPTPVNTIAETVMITSGSMTTAADRLVERGLVQRTAHATDKRVRVVELTDAGRELIAEAYDRHSRTIEDTFAGLTADERATLFRLLLRLRHTTRTREA